MLRIFRSRIVTLGVLVAMVGLAAFTEQVIAQIPPPGPGFCPAICWRILVDPQGNATDCPTFVPGPNVTCATGNPNCKSGIPQHNAVGGQCEFCVCTWHVALGFCQCGIGAFPGGGGGGGGGGGDPDPVG